MYRLILKPILFLFDPEKAHYFIFRVLRILFAIPGSPRIFRFFYEYRNPKLEKEVFGLKFRNPVGLAAGFDKDALIGEKWANLGFGFVELGTVTPLPQAGNPKPRLFRLPDDQGLINRMGFNNGGLEEMVERLKKMKSRKVILGGNIGKNKDTPNEKAAEDYLKCFEALHPWVDYFVVNVSSPNTPGLRALQDREPLSALLQKIMQANAKKTIQRPVLLKIAPDLSEEMLNDVIEIVQETGIDGIVATNTTLNREGLSTPSEKIGEIGAGGLSGKPLNSRTLEVVRYIQQKSEGKIPVIGVGGIMNAKDAQSLFDAGASLIQVYSGFVYSGPGLIKDICRTIQ